MIEGQFSRTALGVAGMRAAHQVAEGGRIFADPFAALMLGGDLDAHIRRSEDPETRPLRLFVALRSRIAEDIARDAIADGARQVVALGAGLDTFACRAPAIEGLRVFEVDHPATQAEKRRRLEAAGVPAPSLCFAPCDFEQDSLADALTRAGFDNAARSVFLWLGVTPYLTRDAIEGTLRYVAGLTGGAEIVFDYSNPPESIESAEQRARHARMAARVAAQGETFRTYFATPELHELLCDMGCAKIRDFGPREIAQRLGAPPRGENGGHIAHADFRR